ncbi:hypothetical protein QQ045_002201 [Rhodiola kirilowii]
MAAHRFFLLAFLTFQTIAVTVSSDHGPLQDFCVGDSASPTFVNGLACIDPDKVQATDFFFSGLHQQGNTSNAVGSKVTPVNVVQIPGLNTQGLSMKNIESGNAAALAALNSQNPGAITIANAVFGSSPDISSDVLTKAFQVDKSLVSQMQFFF